MGRSRIALRLSAVALGGALLAPLAGLAVPAVADTSSSSPAALAASVALGRKAAVLVQLGVFSRANSQGLPPTVQSLSASDTSHAGLVKALRQADAAGQRWLDALQTSGSALFPPVEQALASLPATDASRAAAGKSISLSGDTVMLALDSLLFDDGQQVIGRPADPQAMQSALATAVTRSAGMKPPAAGAAGGGGPDATTQAQDAAPPTSAPVAATPSGPSRLPLIIGVIAALAFVGAAFLVLRTRRRGPTRTAHAMAVPALPHIPASRNPAGWTPPADSVRGSLPPLMPPAATAPLQMAQLLDISRRLASITAVDEIHRVIAREAVGLVDAAAAALIVRDGEQLVVAHEGRPGLLVADRLTEGAIGRVAETGQPSIQVSATEPGIRQLPAAMLAVPLVAGGAVAAVLVLIRDAASPFTGDDRDLLMALTPVAAAAMHGAAQTTAAMRQSLQDALTGVANRLRFDRDLDALLTGDAMPVSLVMLDLDHFKSVNDTHGHPAGDALLRGLGVTLRESVRPGDGVYRYGGEEFAVLLPGTGAMEAAALAERIRAAVESARFDVGAGAHLTATTSVGVATVDGGGAATLVALADAALYDAKRGGRNRVCISPAPVRS